MGRGHGRRSDEKGFGNLLRQYRTDALLTQEVLAERADITSQAVSLLELGKRSPRPYTVERLADALTLDDERRAALVQAARTAGDPSEWTGTWTDCREPAETVATPATAFDWTLTVLNTLADSITDVLALPYAFMPHEVPAWVANTAGQTNAQRVARLLNAASHRKVAEVLSRAHPMTACQILSFMDSPRAWAAWSLLSHEVKQAIAESTRRDMQ